MSDPTAVVVIASLRAKPGAGDELVSVFEQAIAPTHAEDGCIKFAMHRDNADPDQLVFVEKWASQAAIDAHLAGPGVAALGEKLGPLLAEPPAMHMTSAVPSGDPDKGAI